MGNADAARRLDPLMALSNQLILFFLCI